MAKLLDAIAAAQGALVWIEYTQYSERLLAGRKSHRCEAAHDLRAFIGPSHLRDGLRFG